MKGTLFDFFSIDLPLHLYSWNFNTQISLLDSKAIADPKLTPDSSRNSELFLSILASCQLFSCHNIAMMIKMCKGRKENNMRTSHNISQAVEKWNKRHRMVEWRRKPFQTLFIEQFFFCFLKICKHCCFLITNKNANLMMMYSNEGIAWVDGDRGERRGGFVEWNLLNICYWWQKQRNGGNS